jgi:hypothetical protein
MTWQEFSVAFRNQFSAQDLEETLRYELDQVI